MANIRVGSVALDCADPIALGAFWAELLGGEVAFSSEEFVAVKTDRVWVTAVRVPDHQAPTWPDGLRPKQMHLTWPSTTWARPRRRRCGSARCGPPTNPRRTATSS